MWRDFRFQRIFKLEFPKCRTPKYKPAVVAKWLSQWRDFQYFNAHDETKFWIPLGVDLQNKQLITCYLHVHYLLRIQQYPVNTTYNTNLNCSVLLWSWKPRRNIVGRRSFYRRKFVVPQKYLPPPPPPSSWPDVGQTFKLCSSSSSPNTALYKA